MVIKQSELSLKKTTHTHTFINSEIQTLNDSNFTDWVRTVAQWIVAHRAVVHRTVADQTVDHLLSTLQIAMPRKKKRRKKRKNLRLGLGTDSFVVHRIRVLSVPHLPKHCGKTNQV